MRIIGGSLKGLQLISWKASTNTHIRPMMDRMKETLFNMLQFHIDKDVLFLDLFSGTGNIALEAISRGVRHACAVESHPKSIALMQKNTDLLGSKKHKMSIHKDDVFYFLKNYRSDPFHIIVASPPFPAKLGGKIMETLAKSHSYILGTIVVIETGLDEQLEPSYSPLHLFSEKEFSDQKLWFYEAKK